MDRIPLPTASVRAYDASAVEELLASAAAERTRLVAALDAANLRIDAARQQLTVERDLRIRIGALVIDVERRHQQIEAETAFAIEELLAAADAEAEVCLATARADVARQKLLVAVQHAADTRPSRPPTTPAAAEHPSVIVPAADAVVIDLDERRSIEVG